MKAMDLIRTLPLKGRVEMDIPMKELTTLRVGGKADCVVFAGSESDVEQLALFCADRDVPLTVVGRGSNLLVRDGGLSGVVLLMGKAFADVRVEKNRVYAQAGATLGAAARARDSRLILVAADAAENSVRRVRHFADAGQCLWCRIGADKDALGRAVGRSSCAMLAVTDIGFAEAIAKKLAEGDERFAETAEKLAVKARRAAERRREAEAHEKNVRTGKKRPAKKAAEAGEAEPKRTEKRPALRTAAGAGGKRPTGAQSRGDAKKPSREERKRSAVKAAARARYADSRPVKRGKGSAKKEKQ